MLETERQYFVSQQKALAASHPDKFVLIKGRQVVGVRDNQVAAFQLGVQLFSPEPFLIRSTDDPSRITHATDDCVRLSRVDLEVSEI